MFAVALDPVISLDVLHWALIALSGILLLTGHPVAAYLAKVAQGIVPAPPVAASATHPLLGVIGNVIAAAEAAVDKTAPATPPAPGTPAAQAVAALTAVKALLPQ